MTLYWLFLFCAISYAVGNINFSVIISKFLKGDIRKSGSGNPGATNMVRSYGFKWGFAILVLDMLKGALPALTGLLVFGIGTEHGRIALYACGLAAVLGHCFPALYKFKGGKGVSTTVGVFFVANPALAALALSAGMIYGAFFEYASISSILFITACALWEGFMQNYGLTVHVLLGAFYLMILYTHRKNILRLITGGERRASLFGKVKLKRLKANQVIWLEEVKQNT